ncbi:MAG: tetratricopeptide repeat protein [Myxococcales bacterium]
MKSGLAVFGTVNGRLRLLPECRLSGQYRYFAIQPRRQQVALNDERLIRVNVPLDGGASLPDMPVTLDLVRVGRLTTTRRAADGAALLGACDSATHFARTLSVGEVIVPAAAGNYAPACLAATVADVLPPPGCRTFLRAELVALSGARLDTGSGDITFCPPGWALADGLCVSRESATAYECRDAPAECRAECAQGNAASCSRLAYLLAHGEQGLARDEPKAISLYQRACDAGCAVACFNLGAIHGIEGTAAHDDKMATKYWDLACRSGYPAACSNLGLLYAHQGSSPRQREAAVELFGRACAGGDPIGCMNAVVVMRQGVQAPVEQEMGVLLDLACTGDLAAGCLELASWLDRHGATPGAAKQAVEKACRLGSEEACRKQPGIQEL